MSVVGCSLLVVYCLLCVGGGLRLFFWLTLFIVRCSLFVVCCCVLRCGLCVVCRVLCVVLCVVCSSSCVVFLARCSWFVDHCSLSLLVVCRCLMFGVFFLLFFR